MTIKEALEKGTIQLKVKNIETPKMKARLLMQYVLDKPRQYLLVHDKEDITDIQKDKYFKSIEKLIQGIPLQHITHQQEFMNILSEETPCR